jgi:phosphohistidine phosphatase SixA
MRRRLMIMRHAKSSWKGQVPTDHDRPLNTRGRRDAVRVGKRLAKLGWVPDLVVSSDSRRTRETWERMQRRFPEARVSFTRADRRSCGPRSRASLPTRAPCWSSVTTRAGRKRWQS